MKKEEMIKEIEEALGKANCKLADLMPETFQDVAIALRSDDHGVTVSSGDREILSRTLDGIDGLKAIKKAIWSVVDQARERKPKAAKRDDIYSSIAWLIAKANEDLSDIVREGKVYDMGEVALSAEYDSAGVYIKSGSTPIFSAVRTMNPQTVLSMARQAIQAEVEATRAAVERRSSIRDDAVRLAAEDSKRAAAKAALVAAGQDPSILGGIDENTKSLVVGAVTSALEDARRSWASQFGVMPDIIRLRGNLRLTAKTYDSGLVVSAGGKPCLVTRYPKMANAKATEKMLDFVRSEIAAIAENMAHYFRRVRTEVEREEALHGIAKRLDEAEAELKAAAAM